LLRNQSQRQGHDRKLFDEHKRLLKKVMRNYKALCMNIALQIYRSA